MAKLVVSVFLVSLVSFIAVECSPNQISYNMPTSCRGRTYCEDKGDDYPSDKDIVDILKHNNLYETITATANITHRQGNAGHFECNGSHKFTPIYYIVDQYNVTRAVIQSTNSEIHYIQKYDITRCGNDGPTSFSKHISSNQLNIMNIKLNCVTSYSYFDFHVLSSTDPNKVESVIAELPVCCKCRYDKI